MKKISVLFLLFCFLAAPFCVDAQESKDDKKAKKQIEKAEKAEKKKAEKEEKAKGKTAKENPAEEETAEEVTEEDAKKEKIEDPLKDAPKKPEIVSGRGFEMGFNFDVFFSNNYFSLFDFFKKTIIIDLDKISSGLKLDAGANIRPFYFMVDSKKGWGFGLSFDIDTFGLLDLNKSMLSFDEADGAKSTASGATFVSAGVDTFFQIQKFKIKFRPALYYTAAYVKTDLSYSYINSSTGTSMSIEYDMQIFTAAPIDDLSPGALSGKPGLDFSFGFEYPLSRELGFSSSVMDFDIGLDFINVPLISSSLKDYKRIEGSIGDGTSIDILDNMDGFIDSISTSENNVSNGTELIKVKRPFKALMSVNWRPTGKRSFVVTPVLGFALNDLYLEPFGVEAGVNLRLSAANMFVFMFGVNYMDRAWNNSFDFALNLKAFELCIGAKMRSADFIKSWTGHGVGVNFGIKFGW